MRLVANISPKLRRKTLRTPRGSVALTHEGGKVYAEASDPYVINTLKKIFKFEEYGAEDAPADPKSGHDSDDLDKLTIPELKVKAAEAGIEVKSSWRKADLIKAILEA